MDRNYNILPEHMRESMRLYVEQGIIPGDFLQAVLSNDLITTLALADPANMAALKDYQYFLHNEVPAECFGSTEEMYDWHDIGGLQGFRSQSVSCARSPLRQ